MVTARPERASTARSSCLPQDLRTRASDPVGLSLERRVQSLAPMTTLGDLVSALFAKYQRQFHDEEIAAIATRIELEELLRKRDDKR